MVRLSGIDKSLFEAIFDKSPLGMVVVDHKSRFVRVNARFTSIFGYTIEQVPDMETWMKKAYPAASYRKKVQQVFEEDLAHYKKKGEFLPAKNWKVVCNDGTIKIIRFYLTPLENAFLTTLEDITELARKEELLSERSSEAEYLNEFLEAKVNARTLQLKHKQEEVVARNEELNQKNEALEKAKKTIEKQNKVLKSYNEGLEKEVAQRTKDLAEANRKLATNVQKLEQYAFMTAHNLRSPVARLLGLTSLFNYEDISRLDESTKSLLVKIKEQGENLDLVIRDMNTVLELRKETDQEREKIDIAKRVEALKNVLKNKIDEYDVSIELKLKAFKSIKTIPAFFDSIFYNLLSNSIKYRHKERDPVIRLETEKSDKFWIIHVKDNGMGFDMDKYEGQLFNMYKRFHSHVDGKGLGLFLVKSQIDILGGEITVMSELERGTTFSVFFPII